jgi:hypothetical protein
MSVYRWPLRLPTRFITILRTHYIQVCDLPKMAALKEQFPELFVEYKPKKK